MTTKCTILEASLIHSLLSKANRCRWVKADELSLDLEIVVLYLYLSDPQSRIFARTGRPLDFTKALPAQARSSEKKDWVHGHLQAKDARQELDILLVHCLMLPPPTRKYIKVFLYARYGLPELR